MSRYTTSGTVNTVSQINAELEKIQESIATLLSRTLESNNQMSASLDMNSNSILNLPAPASELSPVRVKDLIDGEIDITAGLADFAKDRRDNLVFNVKDYGAVGDNATDDTAAIDSAVEELKANGGGVLYFPHGVYRITSPVEITSNMIVKGAGMFDTRVKPLDTTESGDNRLFEKPSPESSISNVIFTDICLEGTWAEVNREGSGSLLSGRNINNLAIHNCRFLHARFFSINVNLCTNVTVTNCRFLYGCRDMCAVWNSPNTIVANNTFTGNDDDTISLNSAGFEPINGNVKTKIIVIGNTLEDAGGIKVQSANTTIIANNILQRNKGNQQLSVTVNNANDREETNPSNVIIQGNIVTDIIDRFLAANLTPSVNVRVGIRIETKEGTITDPYEGYYSTTGQLNDQPIRRGSGILVKDNLIKRTLPAVAQYSDWGFGRMFTRFSTDTFAPDGFTDPEITEALMQARIAEIEGPMEDITFRDNQFSHSCLEIIDFQVASGETASDFYLKRFRFLNNTFSNCSGRAIDLAPFNGTQQDILVEGNLFDLDPLFVGSTRQSDGSWSGSSSNVAVYASSVGGLRILRNTFKNVASPYIQGGSANQIFKFGNVFVGEPAEGYSVGSFDSNNKGVGLYPLEIVESSSSLFYVASDPLLSNYGEVYTQPEKTASGSRAPTQSYYFKGQFIPSRAGDVDGEFTSLGLRRITSGTGNVIGTDWELLQARLGSATPPPVVTSFTATGKTIDGSVNSTDVTGAMFVGGTDFLYLIDNSDQRLDGYTYSTGVYNSQTIALSGLVFIFDAHFEGNNSRWVCGNDGKAVEYNSNFTATGNILQAGSTSSLRGVTKVGSNYYTANSSGTALSTYNSSYSLVSTEALTVPIGAGSIVGLDRTATDELVVYFDSGKIYTYPTNDFTTATLLLDTGFAIKGGVLRDERFTNAAGLTYNETQGIEGTTIVVIDVNDVAVEFYKDI